MKNRFSHRFSLLALLALTATAVWAAPQAAGQGTTQRYTVLRTTNLTGPAISLTPAQANCVINGSGDETIMKCKPLGVTINNSYHFHTALVIDDQGQAYIIACRMALAANFWCKSLANQRVVRAAMGDGVMSIAEGQGEKPHDYFILASRMVGPIQAPAPAAAAPVSRADRRAPATRAPAAPPAGNSATLEPSLANCQSGTTTSACVAFVSDPPGADIFVDGKFVGNTPSTLTLAPGSHEIRMESAGRKTWTRTVETSAGGRITLRGTLDAQK